MARCDVLLVVGTSATVQPAAMMPLLAKALLPRNLAVFYPHPETSLPIWQPLAAAALLLAISGWALLEWRRRPYLFVGWFWFVGRADDVIKSSGHLISPFEVESALLEHPAVAEAGVVGLPDPVAGAVVKAFVELKPGQEGSEELARQLIGFARKRLGAALAPRSIAFSDRLPRTRSGKIMRRLLRARELGLPEGDTSTLETNG